MDSRRFQWQQNLVEWFRRSREDRSGPPMLSRMFAGVGPDLIINGPSRHATSEGRRTLESEMDNSIPEPPGSSFTVGDKFPVWWSSSAYYFADSTTPVLGTGPDVTIGGRYLPYTDCKNKGDPSSTPGGPRYTVSFPFNVKITKVISILSGASGTGMSNMPSNPGYLKWYTHTVPVDVAHPELYSSDGSHGVLSYQETLDDPIFVAYNTGIGVSADFGPASFETLGGDITITAACHMMIVSLEVVSL